MARHTPDAGQEPVVITVADALDEETARQVGERVLGLVPRQRVVIDLTAITGFDSDGASRLFELQERIGSDRVAVVGLRQAAARMLGVDATGGAALAHVTATIGGTWRMQASREVAVLSPLDSSPENPTDSLAAALSSALATDAAIVVVELGWVRRLTTGTADVLVRASATATASGQELVLKVTPDVAWQLRMCSLGATTHVAEEPADTL
jgi:anti-anti-sigma regulatory factor